MSVRPAPACRLVRTLILLILLATAPLASVFGQADEESGVWLVTYGPGELSWERFGHNAIWVRDRELGLDHTFNFGFFDFEQDRFYTRFLQGRMLYFSAAQASRNEFAAYINADRGIRAQKLALSDEQKRILIRYLVREVRPENRDYLYDYYTYNCSTRVRDVLDLALDGQISRELAAATAAGQSWRDHTRRLTQDDFWLYLGLEIVLGAPVDRPVDVWQEMFVPDVLADALPAMMNHSTAGETPLVAEDVVLYPSTRIPPPLVPEARWPRYGLASLALLAVVWVLAKPMGGSLVRRLSRGWLILGGLAGLVLLFFWFGTDHTVARLNLNLLVFCPLWLPLVVRKEWGKLAFGLVLALSALALLMSFLPPAQYTQDVLAAFLPLNLAAAWVIRKS